MVNVKKKVHLVVARLQEIRGIFASARRALSRKKKNAKLEKSKKLAARTGFTK